jgi:hypothetical protein
MQLRPGDLVRLRAFGGKEIVRRVAGQDGSIVRVCSEEEYQAAIQEKREPECIGFPVKDVIGVEKPSGRAAA